jgi:hypothetical protein
VFLYLRCRIYRLPPRRLAARGQSAGIALLTAVVAGTLAVESRAEHATVEA